MAFNFMSDLPYKGLAAYSEEDALFFFGREKSSQNISDYLMSSRLTLLYGDSGVGKSSVLQAGVAHDLRQKARRNLENYGKPHFAVVVFNSWREKYILKALKEQVKTELQGLGVPSLDLEKPSPGLTFANTLQKWADCLGDEQVSGQIFIIFDQFEEYFLYHSQDSLSSNDQAFTIWFPNIVNGSFPVNFLIAMRSDSLNQLDYFKGSILNLFENRLELKRLSREDGWHAIKKPLDEYNRQQTIINHLIGSRLTVLYGESNVGKSLMLKSGVAHRLRELAKKNLSGKQLVTIFRLCRDNLVKNFLKRVKSDLEDIYQNKIQLSSISDESTITATLKEWMENIGDVKLLVILDQFEEYFHYLQEDIEGTFACELKDAIKSLDLPVNFLISIRQDKLNQLDSFTEFVSQKLSFATLNEEIKTIDIELPLVNTILDEVKASRLKQAFQERGKGDITLESEPGIETSYLQLTMTRLWQEIINQYKDLENTYPIILKIATWDKLGGIQGISMKHIQEQMSLLTEIEKEVAADVFQYLVTPAGTKIAFPVFDLEKSTDFKHEYVTLASVLDKLTGSNRILRKFYDSEGHECYEIFHDVLCQPILKWARDFDEQRREEKVQREQMEKARQERIDSAAKLSLVRTLINSSRSEQGSEKVALLARQAFLFNQKYRSGLLNEVDEALYQALNVRFFSVMLRGHERQVSSVAFSPDSKKIASGSFDGTVQLWELEKKEKSTRLSFGLKPREYERDGGGVLSIAFNPNGEQLAVGCGDGRVKVQDINSPNTKPLTLNGHKDKGEVWSVTFSLDGNLLASGGWDNKLCLWDIENSQNIPICERIHPDWIWSVVFSPDGKNLAAGCRNGTVWLWQLHPSKKLKLIKVLVINEENSLRHKFNKDDLNDRDCQIFSIAFSPDGKCLVAGSQDGKARFWDVSKPDKPSSVISPMRVLEGQNMERLIVGFNHDGQRLAFGSTTGKLQLWKREKDNYKYKYVEDSLLKGHEAHDKKSGRVGVSSIAFSKDDHWLVSGSWDGTVKLWDLRPPKPISLDNHTEAVKTIAFSPTESLLASGSYDNTTRLWEWSELDRGIVSPKNPKDYKKGNVNSVAFSPDGAILASGTQKGEICLWDLKDKKNLTPLDDRGSDVSSIAFLPPDGKIIAAGSHSGKVLLWDLSNINQPQLLPSLKGHQDKINSVAFSPDGNILASGDSNHIVRLWWNLGASPASFIELPRFEGRINTIALSPKPFKELQMLAVATNRETIELWDVSPLQRSFNAEPVFLTEYCSLRELKGISVAFSPDGLFLAAGSYDGNVRLWDLQQPNANPIVLEGLKKPVITIAFTPDGEWLAGGSEDGTIRIWIAKTEKMANMVCQKVWRNLTFKEWKELVGEGIPYERTCLNLPSGEYVPKSGQSDTSSNGFEPQLREDKLMPKQRELLKKLRAYVTHREQEQEPDLSGE